MTVIIQAGQHWLNMNNVLYIYDRGRQLEIIFTHPNPISGRGSITLDKTPQLMMQLAALMPHQMVPEREHSNNGDDYEMLTMQ